MFLIAAGIDKTNYDKTVELTNSILEKMQKGKITEKEIKTAKELYNSSLRLIEENPTNLIREYLTEELTGLENYKERETLMNKVTKKEIVRAFKKVKMDTIFLLEGDIDANN